MRIAAQFMLGTKVRGKGGYLGLLHDVLFDDVSWRVRYLVINTRSWLPGRKVILRPGEAQTLDWPAHEIRVDKSRKEIENSPPLAEHEPVSRQRQAELADYFDWSNLWGGVDPLGPDSPMGVGKEFTKSTGRNSDQPLGPDAEGDPHLRSCKHIMGYELSAVDGEIGEVEDLIVDDQKWRIRYIVARVDAAKWITRARFLVSPDWIQGIDWSTRSLTVDLTRQEIEECPEFEPTKPINRRYEELLCDYYGRPRYWANRSEKNEVQ